MDGLVGSTVLCAALVVVVVPFFCVAAATEDVVVFVLEGSLVVFDVVFVKMEATPFLRPRVVFAIVDDGCNYDFLGL